MLSEPEKKFTTRQVNFDAQTQRQEGFLYNAQQFPLVTNKQIRIRCGKQIQPMCGCHCYYLWSLSLNRLLARWARNGQSGLDCINYSSSPLYKAVPCHTIVYQAYHNIPVHTHLLYHTAMSYRKTQCNTKSRHIIPATYHITSTIHLPPLNGQSTIPPLPLYPSTPLSLWPPT